MADVSFKKFSELAVTNSLIAADIIPVVTVTGGNNSKQITYGSLAQTVSASLIGPFTTTITAVEPASAGKWNSTYSTVYANSASWNTGGSTNGFTIFKQISSIASPNTSTTVHALSIISSQTNVDVAILSKGSGATLAQIPDSGSTGGNKRGVYATDWQKFRSVNTKVASGDHSTIGGGGDNIAGTGAYATVGGGYNNAATNTYSTVGGGNGNTATNTYSTIAGGNGNTATNTYSTVGGGSSNDATGDSATIAGGNGNTANNTYSTVGGGVGNTAGAAQATIGGGGANVTTGDYSTIGGGASNTASGSYSTIAGGTGGVATQAGQLVYSVGSFLNPGDAQMSTFLLRSTTSSAVSTVCLLNDSSEITMLSSETMFVTATIACLSSHENNAGYFGILKGVARCNAAGNVTVHSLSTVNITRSSTLFNASLSAASNKLRVVVFAPSTQTFKWNVKLEALSINGL